MDTVNDRNLGKVILFKDFVKKLTNKHDGSISYKQSNTKLEGYYPRTIGLCKYQDNILAAVAVVYDPNREDPKAARYAIKQRLEKILANKFDINPGDNYFTYVPVEYSDFLWKDPHTYGILHGMIDPTYGNMVIKDL